MNRRYEFVDGLRGLLVLMVVVYHVGGQIRSAGVEPYDMIGRFLFGWILYGGGDRVAMFSALSGFCLMLPVVLSANQEIRGGTFDYLKRRAKRILPAYYVAIALSYLLFWRSLSAGTISRQDFQEQCGPAVIGSHLLLVHNFIGSHLHVLLTPAWNLSIEWQCYLLFCFVLIPIWRRFGGVTRLRSATLALLGAGVLFACLPVLLPRVYNLAWSCPWLVSAFVLGMLAAVAVRSLALGETLRLPLEGIGLGALVALIGVRVLVLVRVLDAAPMWATHLLAATFASVVMICCAQNTGSRVCGWVRSFFLPLLESRILRGLGVISYSIYLSHSLLLGRSLVLLRPSGIVRPGNAPVLWCIELILVLVAGVLFYCLVERQLSLRAPKPSAVSSPLRNAASVAG